MSHHSLGFDWRHNHVQRITVDQHCFMDKEHRTESESHTAINQKLLIYFLRMTSSKIKTWLCSSHTHSYRIILSSIKKSNDEQGNERSGDCWRSFSSVGARTLHDNVSPVATDGKQMRRLLKWSERRWVVVSINNSFISTTPISLHCTYRCRCHQLDSRKQTVSNKLHQYRQTSPSRWQNIKGEGQRAHAPNEGMATNF